MQKAEYEKWIKTTFSKKVFSEIVELFDILFLEIGGGVDCDYAIYL